MRLESALGRAVGRLLSAPIGSEIPQIAEAAVVVPIAPLLFPFPADAPALDKLVGDLLGKAGGQIGVGAAVQHPLGGAGDVELFPGAGDGHIAQPPFLLHLLRIADGHGAGEQPLLRADDEDYGKFQALGRMHRHQHGGVGIPVIRVHIRIQRHFVQEAVQVSARGLHILDDAGFQLADVLDPGQVFVAALCLQRGQISGALQQFIVKLVKRHLGDQRLQAVDHPAELLHPLSGGDARPVRGGGHHLEE